MEDIKENMLKTGTTILGIVCKNGVVMAADRRGTVGNMVYFKDMPKVQAINGYLVFSGCGSATEIQKVPKLLTAELKLKELKTKSRPMVKQAASLLSNIQVSQSAFLLAGFDENGEASLYDVLAGHLGKVKDYSASLGSGMPYAIGLLERQYKKSIDVEEGVELAKECLKSSTQRDEASGNGIDVFTITKEGIKKVVTQTIEPEYRDE